MCLSWNSSLNELDWDSVTWKCHVPPVGPSQKVKDISLLHMCIALLKQAKEKMGEQVWSEQRGDAAGWTCMKQGQNYSSSRGWFKVPLFCSFLRMKVVKLTWSKAAPSDHEDQMKWFLSLLSCQEEPERPWGESWFHWGFPAEATNLCDDGL